MYLNQPPDPLSELIDQYAQADPRRRRKLKTQILRLLQQSPMFWRGEGIDADCYAQAYQSVMVTLWGQLDKFRQQQLQQPRPFACWVNAHLAIKAIDCSGKIWRNSGKDPDVYEEALQITKLEIFEKFEDYDPQRALLTHWFNRILKYRIIDTYRRNRKKIPSDISINNDIEDETGVNSIAQTSNRLISMDAIPDGENYVSDHQIYSSSSPDPLLILQSSELLKKVRQWVEDAQGKLVCRCLRGRLDINCFSLILHRLPQEVSDAPGHFIDGLSWSDIAKNLSVPARNIRQHFNQQCLPLIKKSFPIKDYR